MTARDCLRRVLSEKCERTALRAVLRLSKKVSKSWLFLI